MSRRSEVVYADAVPIQPAFPGKRPETDWPDRVSIMLGSLLPQAVGENDENRRRKIAIAFFSDEKRLEGLTISATRGREIRVAKIVIRPALGLPAQTDLRKRYCVNQNRYQYGDVEDQCAFLKRAAIVGKSSASKFCLVISEAMKGYLLLKSSKVAICRQYARTTRRRSST